MVVAAAISLVSLLTAPVPKNATVPFKPASDARFTSVCSYLDPYLPSDYCECQDEQYGGVLQCSVDVLGYDTVGVVAKFEPCASPLNMGVEVTEANMGIDFPITGITAGTDEEYPVPGLVWTILAASAQGMIAAKIEGNIQDVTVSLGVDACATVLGYKKCGKDLLTGLPIYLLEGEFDFSDLCDAKSIAESQVEAKDGAEAKEGAEAN